MVFAAAAVVFVVVVVVFDSVDIIAEAEVWIVDKDHTNEH